MPAELAPHPADTRRDEALEAAGATPGDRIRVTTAEGVDHEGRLMPTHGFSEPGTLVVKLDNGYNIGIAFTEGSQVELLFGAPELDVPKGPTPEAAPELPKVELLGTGGTIASYVDYRTGAVHPAKRADDLALMVPEIYTIANVEAKVVFEMFSEDMQPEHWQRLAKEVADAFDRGASGVVIPHGTDTLGYTAAALAFMLPKLPGPVVLVGAQRSSDRPSSDAALNLTAAIRVAADGGAGEVVVVMHETSNDDRLAIHRGVRVRKMHTSRRDAFRSINRAPIGYVEDAKVVWRTQARSPVPLERQEGNKMERYLEMSEEVSMIQSYPGLWPEHLDDVIRKGAILIGTGLGHVARRCLDAVKRAVDRGAFVVMTSQCYWGRVDMHVYATGRDLINNGVLSGEDMLPEVAYIKLMWILGHTEDRDEVHRLLATDLVGELDLRTEMTTFLK